MPETSRSSVMLAGLAGAALLIGAAMTGASAQQQPMPPAEFSEGQIDSFVEVALEVQRVQEDFNAEVQGVDDAGEVERLQQEAQEEARQAIQDGGLSVDEYNTILHAANQDPELYAMIVERMQQAQ